MNPGDIIHYQTAKRRRIRVGRFVALSECGGYLKIKKVWRSAWIEMSAVTKPKSKSDK